MEEAQKRKASGLVLVSGCGCRLGNAEGGGPREVTFEVQTHLKSEAKGQAQSKSHPNDRRERNKASLCTRQTESYLET